MILDAIIQKLKSEDEKWDGILELKMLSGPEHVPALIPYLKSPDWVIRWSVAEKLGELKDRRAILPLARRFNDPDAHVRKSVEKSLIQLGPSCLEFVIPYLTYPDAELRKQATAIVLAFKDKAVYRITQAISTSNWALANRLADLLFQIGGEQAERVLIELIQNPLTQKNAILYLGRLKSRKAIPRLVAEFEKPNLRRLILYTLSQIGETECFTFLVKTVLDDTQKSQVMAEKVVIKIGKPILPYLVRALTKPNIEKKKLISLIKKIGPEPIMDKIHELASKDDRIKVLTIDIRTKYPNRKGFLDFI